MKQTVLEILETNIHRYVSGEEIASLLCMTRANVWKEVQKLRKIGIEIASCRNLGYKLIDYKGNLSKSVLIQALPYLHDVEIFETLTSTNDYAKAKIVNNLLILANHQTKGRGRLGRTFYSPKKSGIYMSLTLEPKLDIMDVQLVTICAALAVCLALESLYKLKPKIKWLNDIYLNHHKLCGILTEGEIELESNHFRHIILGIGINTNLADDIPKEISSIYTALSQHISTPIDRNQLIITIINHFYYFYNALPLNRHQLIDLYKQRSNVLGQLITIKNQGNQTYLAEDITPQAHLVVVDKQGIRHELNAGEISLGGLFDDN